MDTIARVRLGRTGVSVSAAGLGCGGPSRLGQQQGASEAESIALVRRALDLGVTFVDTAAMYGTEEIVGRALAGRRSEVVLSTKIAPDRDGRILRAEELARALERSLTQLKTDCVDVYHLHGVAPEHYDRCRDELVPMLLRLREQGKLRWLGITERFSVDSAHAMLQRALAADDCWDVMMVGFSLLNPSAQQRVFPRTRERDVGTLVMFAVRRALSRPADLARVVAELVARGALPADALDPDDPLGFLCSPGGAESVVDAAYRYCRHTPGADVILTGTGSLDHLEANLRSLGRGPLRDADRVRLHQLFGRVDFLSGN